MNLPFYMNYSLRSWLSAALVVLSLGSMAQTTGIRGYVLERGSQAPIPYAQVNIEGVERPVYTNVDGLYQVLDLPVSKGKLLVTVMATSYEDQSRRVEIKPNRVVFERFLMEESKVVLGGVTVNAKRLEQQSKIATAKVQLSPKTIIKFSIGGEPDLVRALQVLPGVVTTGDQGGQLYIRGGSPIQNLVKLDGMILYNPFHSIGFFSVFDTDILSKADVYTAGFGAQYGGRTSSVMDIRTRTANREKVAGKLTSSTYMTKALVEVPIGPKNEHGLALSSLLVSGKQSYLNEVAPYIYPHVATQYGSLPFYFRDLYGKYTIEGEGGSQVNVFGFNFQDAVRFSSDKEIAWDAVGYGADFVVIPPASATIIEAHIAQSYYNINSTELVNRPRSSSISGFNGGLDFTYLLRDKDEFKYGLEFVGYRTEYDYTNTVGRQFTQFENTTELAGYLAYRREVGRWLIQPGLRIHNYGSLAITRMEPRLGVKYNATEFVRLKASAGRYSQNLVAANSDRDVVNLFYGFLSGSVDLPSQFNGDPVNSKLQTADHIVVGTEMDLSERWSFEAEVYAKRFNQITNINRYKIYDDIPVYEDKDELLRKDFIVESGLARGVDFLLTYDGPKWYLWAVYSLGKVTRFDGVVNYAPHFDRRHNINTVLTYKAKHNLEVNFRWNFGSGFPFTPIRGYYELLPFTDPAGQPYVDYTYPTTNGEMGILYGELNSQRLPYYHRGDLTISKFWEMSGDQRLSVALAATNIYNRANIFYYNTAEAERVDQLPFMPTLMLGYAF